MHAHVDITDKSGPLPCHARSLSAQVYSFGSYKLTYLGDISRVSPVHTVCVFHSIEDCVCLRGGGEGGEVEGLGQVEMVEL